MMDSLARLKRKIGSDKDISDEILTDYLEEAKDEIVLFLNVKQFDEAFASKAVEIAAMLLSIRSRAQTGQIRHRRYGKVSKMYGLNSRIQHLRLVSS